MIKEILITIIASTLTGVLGWMAGRKKNIAQTRSIELENIHKAIKIWREMAEKFEVRTKDMEDQIEKLTEENKRLSSEVALLKKKITSLIADNKRNN